MDDLSFEEFEIEYKYLKAVIEGGLGTEAGQYPDLRHLVTAVIWSRETFQRQGGPATRSFTQTIPFRRSFPWYTSFGVTIYFGAPDKKAFQNIVRTLAEKYHIDMPEEELASQGKSVGAEPRRPLRTGRHSSLSITSAVRKLKRPAIKGKGGFISRCYIVWSHRYRLLRDGIEDF